MSEQDDQPLAPWMRAALLSEGLDGGPSEAQKRRMAGKLALAVGLPVASLLDGGGGGVPPTDGGAGGGAAGAAGAGGIASGKVAAIVGALAVGSAVGVAVSELRPRDRETAAIVRDSQLVAVESIDAAEALTEPIDAPDPIDAATSFDAAPTDDTPRAKRDAGTARATPDAQTAMTADELARERELIDIARSALRRNDLRLAAKSLVEHGMRYPKGALVEEQRVLAIELAVAKGESADAAQKAAAFRRDYPKSVFRKRVDELVPP